MNCTLVGVGMSVWQDGVNPKAIACGLVSGLASTGSVLNYSEIFGTYSKNFIWEVF